MVRAGINHSNTHCLCLDVRVRKVDQKIDDRDRLTNIRRVVCVSCDPKDRSPAHAHASLTVSLLRPAANAARLSRDAKKSGALDLARQPQLRESAATGAASR